MNRRRRPIRIRATDLFCGAGGTSMGMGRACRDLNVELDLLAINHWPVAIETHSRNHPAAVHLCETLDSVDPRKVVRGGKLHLLVASPECTHHSQARGGKPIHDQSRASAWHVTRWLDALKVDSLIVENVPEFQTWGPLDTRSRPVKSRKGETFQAWVNAIRAMGYTVEHRVLNAADYGDATTRRRLFVLARKGSRKHIDWPAATHGPGTGRSWKPARDIIDWNIPGRSIYGRKKPLAPKTIARIAEGIRRYSGGAFTLAQGGGGVARPVGHPLPTITTDGAVRVVEPFLVPFYGERPTQAPRTHSIQEPVPTIPATGDGKFALVEPFVYQFSHGGRSFSMDRPLPTITAGPKGGDLAVVEPFITTLRQHGTPKTLDEPLTSISTSGNHHLLVEAFIACYYGTTNLHPVSEPLPTVTTKDRFALVEPVVIDGYMLDIRVRMLQVSELAGAMSFDATYEFTGTQADQKKQIGNAVPGELARALCRAQLSPYAETRSLWEHEATA